MRLKIPNFLTFPVNVNQSITLYKCVNKDRGEIGENGRVMTVITYSSGTTSVGGIEHILTRKYMSPDEFIDIGPIPPLNNASGPSAPERSVTTTPPEDWNNVDQVAGESQSPFKNDVSGVDTTVAGESRHHNHTSDAVEEVESPQTGQTNTKRSRAARAGPSEQNKQENAKRRKTFKAKRPDGEIEFKHMKARNGDCWTDAPEEFQKVGRVNDEEYFVEKIEDVRFRSSGTQYLVKWIGWSKDFSSWESAEKFSSEAMIVNFMNERKARIKEMLQDKDNKMN